MEKTVINPWQWQDQYGFVQANAVSGVREMLVYPEPAIVYHLLFTSSFLTLPDGTSVPGV